MSTKVTNAALIAEGKKLLTLIRAGTIIPYVDGGMTLASMDCQGLVEYCLIQAGVPKSECNLRGSNAHWRAAMWRGTPEEIAKILGSVPAGACPCIHAYDGGEVKRGYNDALGNCSHIGLYLGGTESIAASASRGQVIESNFKGKTVPNGGWNALILLPWVNYGLSAAQLAALGIGTVSNDVSDDEADGLTSVMATATPAVMMYGTVVSANGKPVNVREQPKKGAISKYALPIGTRLQVLGEVGDYYNVIVYNKPRWIQKPYLMID